MSIATSTSSTSWASAPGKLLIAGEYAVLEGGPALVMAINRRVRASFGSATTAASALHSAIADTLALTPLKSAQLKLDSSELFKGGKKLGLGSSAALSVAAAALLSADDVLAEDVFAAALNIHRHFQAGRGSGFDVAASTYGGVLIHRVGDAPKPTKLPADLYWQAFNLNAPASTRRAIHRWQEAPDAPGKRDLVDAADRVCASLSGTAAECIDTIAEFQSRLLALDHAHSLGISMPIQASLEAEAKRLARHFAAALIYKQSGAGGGDIGLALANDRRALKAFEGIAVQSGLEPLDLVIDMQGVTRD